MLDVMVISIAVGGILGSLVYCLTDAVDNFKAGNTGDAVFSIVCKLPFCIAVSIGVASLVAIGSLG
jgi:hypothetical protein